MTGRFNAILILCLCLTHLGCSKEKAEPNRYAVSGTVTLNGQPLKEGRIYFKTVETGANDGADIKDGKFAGQSEAGPKRVEVSSLRTVPIKGAKPPMPTESKEETLPAKYNQQSTLTATVTESGPNEFKFEVKSK